MTRKMSVQVSTTFFVWESSFLPTAPLPRLVQLFVKAKENTK